jgi:hypothetical protein
MLIGWRWLYIAVLGGGLLWIVNSKPLALEPTRVLEAPKGAAAGAKWDREEQARTDEFYRRLKIVSTAAIVLVLVGESARVASRFIWRRM